MSGTAACENFVTTTTRAGRHTTETGGNSNTWMP